MKKINATITITGVINSDETEKTEFITEGAFYLKNGSYYILYDEKEELGMADCSVIVKVSENEASVNRTGDFSSKMYYKSGEVTEFLYHTPYGKFPVILSTQEIKNNLNIMGGRLEIFYSVTISNEENYHILRIEVKTEESREI